MHIENDTEVYDHLREPARFALSLGVKIVQNYIYKLDLRQNYCLLLAPNRTQAN